jgi:hypothetical protein
MTPRTVRPSGIVDELAIVPVLVTCLAVRIPEAEPDRFRSADGLSRVTPLAEHGAMRSAEREAGRHMVKLQDQPALRVMTAGAAPLCDARVELTGMRVPVARLAPQIVAVKLWRPAAVHLPHFMAARAGDGLVRALQREAGCAVVFL